MLYKATFVQKSPFWRTVRYFWNQDVRPNWSPSCCCLSRQNLIRGKSAFDDRICGCWEFCPTNAVSVIFPPVLLCTDMWNAVPRSLVSLVYIVHFLCISLRYLSFDSYLLLRQRVFNGLNKYNFELRYFHGTTVSCCATPIAYFFGWIYLNCYIYLNPQRKKGTIASKPQNPLVLIISNNFLMPVFWVALFPWPLQRVKEELIHILSAHICLIVHFQLSMLLQVYSHKKKSFSFTVHGYGW